jgi:protein-arginine kinase activator protein McsA
MAEPIICEICTNRPARLVLLRRRFDQTYRTFVCSECGQERARLYASCPLDFRRLATNANEKPEWMGDSTRCELCGADLSGAQTDVQPGCCECYSRFPEELRNAVKAIQGCTRHLGKSPAR